MSLQVSQMLGSEYNRAQLVAILQEMERAINRLAFAGGSVTWNPGDILDGDEEATTVTVPGVRAGVKHSVKVFPPYNLQDLQATGHVSANDTVTIVLSNSTGGGVNLAEGVWAVMVEAYPA